MYSNDVIKLYFMLKGYCSSLEEVIRDNDNEFSDESLLVEIENIMNDLKDLERGIRLK